MAAVTLPIVTTYNDKGVKNAQFSLKGLMGTQVAAGVSAGVLVGELGKSVKAFNDDEKAADLLKIAVQNSTGATDLQVASLEAQIKKMEATSAVSDDKLRPALGNLVRATEDVDEAQQLLALALDISAGTGKDLETVSLALAKAQNGNVGALTRLGVSLDKDAVKAKDFETIQRQLATSFKGASDAAAASSAGGMAQLSITIDNLYELVGSQLSPAVSDFASILNHLIPSAADKAAGKTNKLVDAFGKLFLYVTPAGGLIRGAKQIAGLLHTVAGALEETAPAATYTAAEFRDMDKLLSNKYTETLKKTVTGTDSLKKKQEEARKAAKDHADTLRDRVVTAVDEVATHLQDAKDQLQDFADTTASSITGMVSLTDAIKTQDDAAKGVADALKERKDAYGDVAKATKDVDDAMKQLIKTQKGDDAEAIVEATNDVKEAKLKLAEANDALALSETNVNTAQATAATSSYAQVFQKQIADAKKFASNLEYLTGYGLSKAGLSQLINLGPTAGLAVTQDLITSANGMTLASFNESLGSLASSAAGLGLAAGNAFFGGNVAAGQTAFDQAKTYQITVNAGLVSNPAQVGRDIIEAIKSAERLSGQVFVSV
jgi:hypothetical protein